MFNSRFSELFDKLILAVAMLFFIYVGYMSIQNSRTLDSISRQTHPMLSDRKVDIESISIEDARFVDTSWGIPAKQSRGADWVFDVFTPPVIYYNPMTREFSVTSPAVLVASKEEDPWQTFGLELLEVRPRPYRLQLVGYAGEDGNYVAYFEYLDTGDLVLARPGKLLVEAGVKVVSFEVKQMEVQQEGSMPVFENVGVARVLDYQSGEELFLTNLETKIFSDLEARVRGIRDERVYVVREGSQVELDTGVYIIGDLSSEPQEAMVTKVSRDGGKRMSKLLTPPSLQRRINSNIETGKPVSPFAVRPQPSRTINFQKGDNG